MTDDPADAVAPTNRRERSVGARVRRLGARAGRSKLVFALWVAAWTLVVVPLVYSPTAKLGPGTVDASFLPSLHGRTELGVPPLGAVRASTHSAPVDLRLELKEVDVLDAIGPKDGQAPVDIEDPVPIIEADIREDLGPAITKLAITLVVLSVVVGIGAAAAFPGRRSLRRVLAGAGIAPLSIAVLLAPAALTYDANEFERSPELVGQLGSAKELMARVGSLETRFGSVDSRVKVLSGKIANLYSTALTGDIERSDGEVVLLHVSDLHLNTVGLALVRDLAADFQVDAVLDTGDITSFGFEPETAFLELFDEFDMPYYLVAGNHDSAGVRASLARNDDVILLDDDMVDIAGVTVLGVADPTETALRKIPKDVINRTYRDQFPTTRRLVEQGEPDLLMVHNPVQARAVYGDVDTVVAGHIHTTRLEVIDGTVVAVVGSSGATGVGDMLTEDDNPFEFQLLRYVDRKLVAIDQIKLQGAGGDFVLNRILLRGDLEDTAEDLSDDGAYEPSLEEMQELDPDSVTTTTVDGSLLSSTTTSSTSTSTTTTEPAG
ncbi:MAG: metallophosphoesterase [Actinomycetota bacterium]|nr:metallophosphoesterase [Actinomycetota bacterium]